MAKAGPTDINFKGVSGSARRIHVPEGDYLIRGKSVEATESKKTKNPMWVIRWEFVNGPKQGAEIIDRVVLVQQSLFRLRNLLEACGIRVPEGKLTVDPNKIIKMTQRKPIGAQIVDDDAYEGHIPSTVKRYIPADEVQNTPDDEEEDEELEDDELDIDDDDIDELEDDDLEDEDDEGLEDEEDDEELEGDDEPYTEEELEELDLMELKGVAKEVGVPVKKGKKSATYIKEILAAQDADDEELDEEEDEPEAEPEPEPAPRRRRAKKATKAPAKKRASSAVEELEDYDLDDLE